MKAEFMIGRSSINELLDTPIKFLDIVLSELYHNPRKDWAAVEFLGFRLIKNVLQYEFALWSTDPEEDQFIFGRAFINIHILSGDVNGDYFGNVDEVHSFNEDDSTIMKAWNNFVKKSTF